jgi:hypothetical protein
MVLYSFKTDTGKSALANMVYQTMQPFSSKGRPPEVLEKFNELLEGKLLVYLDESVGVNSSQTYESIKTLASDPILVIHPKNRKPYDTLNQLNFLFTTNSTEKMTVTDDERRFFIVDVAQMSDKTGELLYETFEIEEGGEVKADLGIEAIVSYLHYWYKKRDLEKRTYLGWKKIKRNIVTEAQESKRQEINFGLNFPLWIATFDDIQNLIAKNSFALEAFKLEDFEDDFSIELSGEQLYALFKKYLQATYKDWHHYAKGVNLTELLTQIRNYLPAFTGRQARIKGTPNRHRLYTIDIDQIKRELKPEKGVPPKDEAIIEAFLNPIQKESPQRELLKTKNPEQTLQSQEPSEIETDNPKLRQKEKVEQDRLRQWQEIIDKKNRFT